MPEDDDLRMPERRRKVRKIDQTGAGVDVRAGDARHRFTKETVGLVTREEYAQKKKELKDLLEKPKLSGKKESRTSKKLSLLSFEEDGDDEETEMVPTQTLKVAKDPTVDTSFLYDSQRESELESRKLALIKLYAVEQEKSREAVVRIDYMYYDGSGKKDYQDVRKGATVAVFLEKHPGCMLVKDDMILPNNYTFHDMALRKQVGRSGQELFVFEENEDVIRDKVRGGTRGYAGAFASHCKSELV
ncbi:MAG: uncharacterized protein KVP18_002497 [Porospora cf. gigantea A]|uniref:uncharacterized protein n=1 Tax=Porospora cf. gigantea A TaxID=2853593 RepID=UPI003559AEB6|nr:MAG: hypothetical protein KVP18_002497 [Porospora cf. gigantea A]